MAIEVPTMTSFFISGGFEESYSDMRIIQSTLSDIGYTATIKHNNEGPTSAELINGHSVFVTVLGLKEAAIKTPEGDTLPQLELNQAIRERIPVIGFLKSPDSQSISPRQHFFRTMMQHRLGDALIKYDTQSQLPQLCQELIVLGPEVMAKPLKPLKVFICHSSKDKPVVERIVERLNRAQVLTFYDKDSIGVGMNLKKTIKRAISSVGYVLVCLSPASLESEWVRQEIAWALEQVSRLGIGDDDEFILPVRIAPFDITPELKFLTEKHYADIAADFETGMAEILAAVRR